jgi:hypothetical protein
VKALKLSVALQLLLVFVSGALVGGLGYRLFSMRTVPEVGKGPPRPPDRGRQFRQRFIEDMRSRLKLRDDQVKKLTEIMDATGHRFFEEKKRSDAAMKSLQEHQVEQIRAMLDPPQVAEYAKMLAEREKRMREERDRKQRDRGPDSDKGGDRGRGHGP